MKSVKQLSILLAVVLGLSACNSQQQQNHEYNGKYTGKNLDHIAFPLGGIGTGMFCFEGTGCIGSVSLYHEPNLFNEPTTFSAIAIKGLDNGAKVLETNVPDYKVFGRNDCGQGKGATTWGYPRFDDGEFQARFPFANLKLNDKDIPMDIDVTVWSPFIPNDEDNSSLPVASFEYTFKNTSSSPIEAVYSFNSRNFMSNSRAKSYISEMPYGFVLNQDSIPGEPYREGHFAVFTDDTEATCDYGWFRGGWFDAKTNIWEKVANCDMSSVEHRENTPGASIAVPVNLKPGESKTVKVYMAWYVPYSKLRTGGEARDDNERGDYYDPELYKNEPHTYVPWYAHRFASLNEVIDYWKANYTSLRERSKKFSDSFYDTTLPAEVVEAIAANMTIIKSTTVLRQHDGRLWGFEGSGDTWGSCAGTTTHVWNYAQAFPHLFPALERSMRETEFYVSQTKEGHQVFRHAMPIRPIIHNFHSAVDGQLGGIIKVYRDWRIFGNREWIEKIYEPLKGSMDYCIKTWDPQEIGAIEEPHHNTYDIEFWGANGMCTSFYAGALESFVTISKELGKECAYYEDLLAKSKKYMEEELWDGEYFIQKVKWEGLKAGSPLNAQSYNSGYSDEARAILEKEGPKYQYGAGCLSDGVLGCWMALTAGLPEPISSDMTRSHLNSVYKYNFREDLTNHSNPQRPTFAMGRDGGLLICTWPKGGMPSLPFVYSNEVWTGIEYQVAAHLMFEGEVEKGLNIVRKCRDRYDGAKRNPFNEYECGNWYIRAHSSYSMLQALTGVRYDAVTKTLYVDSKIGDFRSFLSTAFGFANVELKGNNVTVFTKEGNIEIEKCIVSGNDATFSVQ